MHTVQPNDRRPWYYFIQMVTCYAGSMHSEVQLGHAKGYVHVVECTLKKVHGLACLTEAVNKGCCWLDQTVSTFWGKGRTGAALLHGWGDWKAKDGWNPWTCRSAVFECGSGLLEGEPRWHAFWWLSAEDDVMLLANKESELPVPCLCSQKECVWTNSNVLKFDFVSLDRIIMKMYFRSSNDTWYAS